MKQNRKKKSNKPDSHRQSRQNEFSDLNSQLGSFGLEPPKIYRNEQPQKRGNEQNPDIPRRHSNKKQKISSAKKPNDSNINEKRRSQNKKRKKKKTLRKIITVASVVLAVVVVMVILSLTVLFKIDTISVSGNSKYKTEQIISASEIEKNTNLFTADASNAQVQLLKKLPYIYQAEVKRKFPSTVQITVKETDTVYYIKNKDNTFTLFDGTLKVLEANVAAEPKDGIEIKKLAPSNAVAGEVIKSDDDKSYDDLLAMMQFIEKLNLGDDITEIYSNDINNNFMVYKGRITFKLGSTADLEDKVYKALSVVEKINDSDPNAKGTVTVTADKKSYFTPPDV